MALDPRLILSQQRFAFGLDPFVEGRASGLQFRRDLGVAQEEEAARARAEQLRQAYRERYGEAPGGLAGPAAVSAAPSGLGGEAYPPLAEQEAAATQQALYGSPGMATPMQAPSGPPPPGPYGQTMQAPAGPPPPGPYGQTLEDRAGQPVGPVAQTMGAGGLGAQSPSQNPFIRKLYTIDPAAGREAEKHALDSRKLELANAKERVEHLGRVADGVLAVGTQEAHNVARAQLIQDGMPPSQIPVAYDPTIWQMFSGMATSSAERLRLGELQLDQAKFQLELRQEGSKAPDYGFSDDKNAAIYGMFGSQIQPGQPPTPAMERAADTYLLEQKGVAAGREQQAKEQAKLEAEKPALRRKQQGNLSQLERQWQTTEEEITSALDLMDRNQVLQQTGFLAKAVIAGTPAYDLRQKLDTIRANIGFDRLQQMREASETGGALGQVSEEENRLLQATAGSLDPKQSPAQLRQNLQRIRADLQALRADRRKAFEEDFGATPPPSGRAPTPSRPLPTNKADRDKEIADIKRQLKGP